MTSRIPSRLLRHLYRGAADYSFAPPVVNRRFPIYINANPHVFNFRSLSTNINHQRRTKKVDIGARARQLQTRRMWAYGMSFSCIAGFVVIVLYQFQDQLVFYVTPTDALEKYNANPAKSKFRLGGLVLENSITHVPWSPETQFVITDLITDILVKYEGSLPDLFREGNTVIVEGLVKPVDEDMKKKNESLLGSNSRLGVTEKARSMECYFDAIEVLAKHDEKYMPAEVAAALEKNKKMLEMKKDEGSDG